MPRPPASVRVGVDVGGTFIDLVSLDSRTGKFSVFKFPTARDAASSVAGALRELGVRPSAIEVFSHATTLATNALLTRTGLGRAALVTNDGFRDVLEIGRQRRPELYDLRTKRPPPLVERKDRFTVPCRTASDGSELVPVDEPKTGAVLSRVAGGGYQSVAVSLLNSYANPGHERKVRSLLRRRGFRGHVSISSDVDNEYREYERTSTTAVNAVLSPLMGDYFSRLQRALRRAGVAAPIFVMNSDGGASTVARASETPVYSIESGPAAGVVASKALAAQIGVSEAITFDMGGTTAKAGCLVGGEPELTREFEAAGRTHSGRSIRGTGYAVRGSFIDLAEVSAGGGTVAWLDDAGSLKVGPKSAGSIPGPACYGKGGLEPTVTDSNVLLGRLSPLGLLGGSMPVRPDLASAAVGRLAKRLGSGVAQTASGVVRLANDAMSRAISMVTVERGRDPRGFTLFAFGGAGPIHACDLAEDLGMRRMVVPVHAGLFSAYGLLATSLERTFTAPVMAEKPSLEKDFRALEAAARRAMRSDGLPRYDVERSFEARYEGQSHELTLPYASSTDIRRSFGSRHRELYGYSTTDPVEVVNIRLKARAHSKRPARLRSDFGAGEASSGTRKVWVGGRSLRARVYTREALPRGAGGVGPCVIEEYDSTLVVNPGWRWRVEEYGTRLSR